jgi:HAMP domain-containing protein
MRLRNRLNLAFFIVFGIGLLGTTALVYFTELQQAREQVFADAEVLLSAALSTRNYTVNEIVPLLTEQSAKKFLPQTVPSFAAQTTFALFQKEHPEFSYREAALNPTNPKDRATIWESELIQSFGISLEETKKGSRRTEEGQFFYIARPVKITNEACLTCHSTPERAPASMIQQYGAQNGFGWKLNEVIGAQIITVPATQALRSALESTLTQVISLVSVFTLLLVAINVILGQAFLNPLDSLTRRAESYSKGDLSMPEFSATRQDEIGRLERSLNRLRRTVDSLLAKSPKDS